MPIPGLFFQSAPPAAAGLPSRADVALFVGLVGRRADSSGAPSAIPAGITAWLQQAGWAASATSKPSTARPDDQVLALLDVPVPIEGWDVFDALFAWDARPVLNGAVGQVVPCALGAAVRSFFAEGGRKCYVVRCGDPLPLGGDPNRAARVGLLAWANAGAPPDAAKRVPVLPGLGGLGTSIAADDPKTWRGAGHLYGLDDLALLSVPDLADLLGEDPQPVPSVPPPPSAPEQFLPVSTDIAPADPTEIRPPLAAPRLDLNGYAAWSAALRFVLDMLRTPSGPSHRRDVTLIASLPLPSRQPGAVPTGTEAWPLTLCLEPDFPATGITLDSTIAIGSALLQLAYPWVSTSGSASLPEGVEAPEGALAGMIARGALANGAFRSVAGQLSATVIDTLPELSSGDVLRGLPNGRADWLGDRISLFAPRSDGFVLMSDATMSDDAAYRAGGVSRLMGIILRAARWLGQDLLFESSGELLWSRITRQIETFLTTLWDLGALNGASPAEAFTVRCDRSTMNQSDLDAGRVIVTIAVTAAQPIERITVTLAMTEGGTMTLAEAA